MTTLSTDYYRVIITVGQSGRIMDIAESVDLDHLQRHFDENMVYNDELMVAEFQRRNADGSYRHLFNHTPG